MFLIRASCHDILAELLVNDILIGRLDGTSLSETVDFVSHWVDEGANVLRVLIVGEAPVRGSGAETPLAEAQIAAEILEVPPRFEGEIAGRPVATVNWRYDEQPHPVTFPQRLQATFNGSALPTRRWAASRPPTDPASYTALLLWLQRLQGALASGNDGIVIEAARPGLLDIAEGHGLAGDPYVLNFAETLRLNSPVEDLEPMIAKDLVFRPIAGGRLIDVRRRDERPAIVTRPGAAQTFSYSVRAGMLGENWYLF